MISLSNQKTGCTKRKIDSDIIGEIKMYKY